jgi:hypothetical protein
MLIPYVAVYVSPFGGSKIGRICAPYSVPEAGVKTGWTTSPVVVVPIETPPAAGKERVTAPVEAEATI